MKIRLLIQIFDILEKVLMLGCLQVTIIMLLIYGNTNIDIGISFLNILILIKPLLKKEIKISSVNPRPRINRDR